MAQKKWQAAIGGRGPTRGMAAASVGQMQGTALLVPFNVGEEAAELGSHDSHLGSSRIY